MKTKASEAARMARRRATFSGRKYQREYAWKSAGIVLTLEEYNRLSDPQGHVCAVCSEPNSRYGKLVGLEVDHDHKTGRVRGLLCHKCNEAIGLLHEGALLDNARRYLNGGN